MACAQYIESDVGRRKIVTSASRPTGASRYAGQTIYETDTLRELTYDGTDWFIMSEPPQTWVPTWASGVTVGNGVWSNAEYQRSNGWIEFSGIFTLGTTSAMGSGPQINHPVTLASVPAGAITAEAGNVPGGAFYPLAGSSGGSTNSTLFALNSAGTYVVIAGVTSTVPFTWAATCTVKIRGRARMASRYS